MPLSTVTFPPVLDHSWSFTTSAIHARPQRLSPDGDVEDSAAVLEQLDEGTFTLTPSASIRWTDGLPVSPEELHVAVTRALALLGHAAGVSAHVVGRLMMLKSTRGMQALRELLASAPFSLTPCVRSWQERHTSGDFVIRDIRERGRLLELEHRNVDEGPDVEVLTFVATGSPAAGLELLRAGELDLSRVLGGMPGSASTVLNAPVGTVMGLRSAPGSGDLRSRVVALLDLAALAVATGGSYDVVPQVSSSGTLGADRSLALSALTYADFYPNGEAVAEILDQLGSDGSGATPVPYSTYLEGDVGSGALRLDLVDDLFESGRHFSALLRARTTITSGPRVKEQRCIVTRRAEIDWAAVRLEES